MLLSIFLIIVGFVFLVKGADVLVDGAGNIAKKFHIPEIIIGLTIVSIGTSMPELFVSITSAIEGYPDMAIGNAIGSNIANLLLVLGLSSIIQSVEFKKETRLIEIPMCLVITLIFLIICNMGLDVTRVEAGILIFLFILFLIYTVVMAKIADKFEGDEIRKDEETALIETEKQTTIANDIFKIILGIILLKVGGDFTVNNAVNVATILGLSEKIISVTILAIGTSLPELVTSVSAAIKKKSDIAIGNILGSNIFNMLLIIGVSAAINPIVYNISYNKDMVFLVLATVLLFAFPLIPPKNKMGKSNGALYLIMYALYMLMLFTN